MSSHPVSSSARYQPLVVVTLAVVTGIVVDRWSASRAIDNGFALWWLLSVLSLAGWWCAWNFARTQLAALFLLVSVALVGAAWHDLRWSLFAHDDVGRRS